jgi:hypothetical protein
MIILFFPQYFPNVLFDIINSCAGLEFLVDNSVDGQVTIL